MPGSRIPATGRRRVLSRLLLTVLALLTLIAGYYLGQYWQRRPLQDLSAVVYPSGRAIRYPDGLPRLTDPASNGAWRLFLTADTRAPACAAVLRDMRFLYNRLAAWPDLQARLRVTVLAYDAPAQPPDPSAGAEWIDMLGAAPPTLDRLAGQLGILPTGNDWCSDHQASAILVSPHNEAWALIPYEQPAIMADNVRTIIQFVE